MNKKDASVIKILTEMQLIDEKPLNAEQEYQLKYATDKEFRFAEDVKNIFTTPQPEENS